MLRSQLRRPGLEALNSARDVRRRAVVLGKVRLRDAGTRFWLWTFAGMAVFGVVYWGFARAGLQTRKQALRASQRAASEALGPRAPALLDRVQGWLAELAAEAPDRVASGWSLDEVSRGPGIYVRLPLQLGEPFRFDPERVEASKHDGFSSCLFVTPRESAGASCSSAVRCEPGLICGDDGHCRRPAQPLNLSYLTRPLDTLAPDWLANLSDVSNSYRVRGFELALEQSVREQLPIAHQAARRARFFTAVLDETVGAEGGGSSEESPAQQAQAEEHFARVGIWSLSGEGRQLLRVRRKARVELRLMGRHADGISAESQRASLRQARGCELARQVAEVAPGPLAP